MALDLYHLIDQRLNIICSLTDVELDILEPCLAELKQKTGTTLDPYGTTPLYPNQINMIIQCLEKKQSNDAEKYKSIDYPSKMIKKFSEFNNGLIAVGD